MSALSFIHLSDIHFVKTSGNVADIDQGLRESIILDIENNAKDYLNTVTGVLVSGDIAFSGTSAEYEKAQKFLFRITEVLGIEQSNVYCVPGNHDVNQNIPKQSNAIYEAQCALDNTENLDAADRIFEKKLNDIYYKDIMFNTINEYNEFAGKFECSINPELLNWRNFFDLDYGMSLYLHGINSSFISNADDHKRKDDNRPMYIGQAQLPDRIDDTVCMILCHHPPECWKFLDVVQEKLNRRADIQLYGHKHTQNIILNKENVIVCSGATHPVRGNDWVPRYNWLIIDCILVNDKRVIRVKIYPRVLDSNRDVFIADTEQCDGKNYIEHILDIDIKRRKHLKDPVNEKCDIENELSDKIISAMGYNDNEPLINKREMVYEFLSLPYPTRIRILTELNLMEDCDIGRADYRSVNRIIDSAVHKNQLKNLWDKVKEFNYEK